MKVRLTIIIVFSYLSGFGQHETDSIVIKGKLFYREYKKDIPWGAVARICYDSKYNVECDHSLLAAVCNNAGEFEIKIPKDVYHPAASLKYYYIGYIPIIIKNIPVQKNIVQLGLLPLFDDTDIVLNEHYVYKSRLELFWRRISWIRKHREKEEKRKKERYRKHMVDYVYTFEGRSFKIDLKTNTIDLLTK